MKGTGTGTVTPLSSVFSVEDTHKAAQRVHHTISHKDLEFDRLRAFVADNSDLINLVTRLPDHLHHDIMVSPPSLTQPQIQFSISILNSPI